MDANPDIIPLFRALADPVRIKIAAAIMDRPLTLEGISSQIGLEPRTLTRHMEQLQGAGLLEVKGDGSGATYRFHRQPLFGALKSVARQPEPQDFGDDVGAFERKVLGDYLVDGTLKVIPAQHKKREVILRYLVQQFEPGREYSEKEVNWILIAFHRDQASLRRYLVDDGLLQRRPHGIYWRELPSSPNPSTEVATNAPAAPNGK